VLIALKASLSDMEAKFSLINVKSDILKKNGGLKISPYMLLVEQQKNAFLKCIMQEWIVKAKELVTKADADEIDRVIGQYLSPNFVKVRKEYLQELEKISSKKFSERVITNVFENVKTWQKKKQILKKHVFGYFIRITFPVEEIRKKLRSFGVLNKVCELYI
jgi:hypothetical protein